MRSITSPSVRTSTRFLSPVCLPTQAGLRDIEGFSRQLIRRKYSRKTRSPALSHYQVFSSRVLRSLWSAGRFPPGPPFDDPAHQRQPLSSYRPSRSRSPEQRLPEGSCNRHPPTAARSRRILGLRITINSQGCSVAGAAALVLTGRLV